MSAWLREFKPVAVAGGLARAIAIVGAVVVAVFPLFWVVLASLKGPADVSRLPPLLVFAPTIQNFVGVFNEGFAAYFRNSLVLTFGSVALCIALGVPAAYGLSRLRLGATSIVMFLVLAVRFVPYIVYALPIFVIMVQLRLIGQLGAVMVVYLLLNLPLVIWLMKSFFDDIPREIDEAAAVDGATRFQAFRLVVLPGAAAGVACVTILSFIFAWNEYLFALILASRDAAPLTVGLTRFLGGVEYGVRWGLLAAWSTAISVPVVVVTLLVHRFIREGFTRGLR